MDLEKTPTAKELHEVIIEIAADYYGNEAAKIRQNSGRFIDHEMVYRKHICYYMLRTYTFTSYDQIALLFNTRGSTIRSGFNKIETLLSYNRRTIAEVADIKKLIDNFREKKRLNALSTF